MKKQNMYSGEILKLPPGGKKFGFIKIEEADQDIFFTFDNYIGDKAALKKGTKVVCKIGEKKDGRLYAYDVTDNLTSAKSRSPVRKKGLPYTVPASELSDPSRVEALNGYVKEDPIMITWFRDIVSDVRGQEVSMTAQNKDMLKVIKDAFPKYEVTVLNWPELYRSNYDTTRTTHPYISRTCRLAVIVSQDGVIIDKTPFKTALVESVYQNERAKSKNCWTLLGDETGGLEEFQGKEVAKTSEMCWVAIPPDSNPPALNQDFHATGNTPYLIKALENIQSDSDILLFSFPFEEGTKTSGLTGVAFDSHLDFWQDTLPLVLEYLSNKITEKTKINIFIEQVGELESGIGVIPPIVRKLKSALNCRSNWERLSFEEMHVLSKNPCEHPWIGYPDALGHVSVEKERSEKLSNLVNNIRPRIISAPYRQSSLNGWIMQAVMDTARPLVFLQSLSSIPSQDIRDYVIPFFSNAIPEALSSLEQGQWQDLLEHIDITSRDKQGQRAAALIHNHIDIDTTLGKLERDSDKFDLLRMMLGTSNHRGEISQGIDCKERCRAMIDSGFKPTDEKLRKFNNLLPGLKDNMFDFSNLVDEIPPYNSSLTDSGIHFLGTKAQTLGLTGNSEYRSRAIEIEEQLSEHGDDRRHHRRHAVLLAELLLDEGERIEAVRTLLERLLKKVPEEEDELLQDSYYVAALIKTCVLLNCDQSVWKSKTKSITDLLDDDHPSQRIAYWCARWATQIGQSTMELGKDCFQHLIELTGVPLFTHDAPGVILSCELLDLVSRGYKTDFDVTKFYKSVIENSQETTKEWVNIHPPCEEDWLAPLNFNYR